MKHILLIVAMFTCTFCYSQSIDSVVNYPVRKPTNLCNSDHLNMPLVQSIYGQVLAQRNKRIKQLKAILSKKPQSFNTIDAAIPVRQEVDRLAGQLEVLEMMIMGTFNESKLLKNETNN